MFSERNFMKMRPVLSASLMVMVSSLALAPAYATEAPAASQTEEAAPATAQPGTVPASAPVDAEPPVVAEGADPAEKTADEQGEQSHAAVSGHAEKQDWSFKGPFGTYDRAALLRGFQVYRQVCASCHSMNRLYYRNLTDLGYTEGQVKTIAADYMITDGPNDEGEMFERAGRPSDHFKAPFANKKAAIYANNGAYPPDMSLLAKARHGGADYIYGILTGYGEPPAGTTLLDGQHWNAVMHGNIIAMAPPLADGMVAYEDGTEGTVHNYARDISQFLTWAAEPHMEIRKQTGIKAFFFLLVFTLVMYGVKKKVWKGAYKKTS